MDFFCFRLVVYGVRSGLVVHWILMHYAVWIRDINVHSGFGGFGVLSKCQNNEKLEILEYLAINWMLKK